MKKLLISLLSLVLFFSVATSGSALATNTINDKSETGDITIVEEHESQGNPNATVEFIDLTKVKEGPRVVKSNGTDDVGTLGVIWEQYTHSTYTYSHHAISAYNVGPLSNNKFLISVATGQTKTMSQSVGISGTVSYEATISGGLKDVINAGLTGSASGTISYTYNTSTSYSGPSLPYTTRDYYGGIEYDKYTTYVNKRNHYDVYNGTIKTGTVSYDAGTVTTTGVKKPKAITYSRDFTN